MCRYGLPETPLLGVCRMMPQGKSDLTCIAFTAGAAVLAVLQWLQDLRCVALRLSCMCCACNAHPLSDLLQMLRFSQTSM